MRMADIQGFGIDRVAAAAETRTDILRLENLDTDIAPPEAAVRATRLAVGSDDANSYLPFTGLRELREAVALRLLGDTGRSYDPETEITISSGGLAGLLSALLAMVDPGDEVIVTDPAYAGLIQRVRLAGAVPRSVPLRVVDGHWRLDLDALSAAVGPRTRVLLLANPSMPSGIVHTAAEWQAVTEACARADAWLLYDAAMERILFDDQPYLHPARLPGLAERTVTVGSVAKEYRMIGWRVGWIAAPRPLSEDIGRAVVFNTVVPSGFAQIGAICALTADGDGVAAAVAEWQARRDTVLEQLDGLPVVIPDGGWSLLLNATACGFTADRLSRALLDHAGVACTPMTTWGARVAPDYVRLVFSNEPQSRLASLRQRLDGVL